MDQDAEVAALNAEHRGRWHVARRAIRGHPAQQPCYVFDAAREPQRSYHVIDEDAQELRKNLARIERYGSLIC